MTRKAIAVISLAPGEIGYYDDYSRIYLSNSNPKATIYSGTNLYQIRKSIKSGRLKVVEGSLVESETIKTKEVKPENTELRLIPSVVEEKVPHVEIENQSNTDVKVAEESEQAVKEDESICVLEEQVEEKKAPKRTRRSRKTEDASTEG